ncbi:MAG: hypothetical protein PHH91_02585 [Desulfuromonadaceae bacterium]|nr:hypothetical protein [Desulfuromonadaceae bacterium]
MTGPIYRQIVRANGEADVAQRDYSNSVKQKGITMTSTETIFRRVAFTGADPGDISWDMSTSTSGAAILSIHGNLKPGWLGRLSSYLSLNAINMISGSARKCGSLCWDASFEIEAKSALPNPLKGFNPLPAIMAFDARVVIPQLKISDFVIEHSTRHGGSLYAEISGKDCIGFLYGMLRMFSFYSLFPTELEISTKGTVVHDRFWLKGIGSAAPSDDDLKALHERLHQTFAAGLKKVITRSSSMEVDTSRYQH